MNVIVLGAEGATGQGLVKYLKSRSDLTYEAYDFTQKNKETKFINLQSRESINSLIQNTQIDIIINCVGSFTNNFKNDLDINVVCTSNLLEAVNQHNKHIRVVLIGTVGEYGIPTTENGSLKENHPLNPLSDYGLTKKIQFDLFNYYLNKYNLDLIYLRPSNLVSKEVSSLLFVGSLYKQISQVKKGELDTITLGYLGNYRDYIAIDDASEKYVKLALKADKGTVVNVGSGNPIMIKDLLEKILKQEGLDMSIVNFLDKSNKVEVKYLFVDISYMMSILNH